jgi:hypothetical protein
MSKFTRHVGTNHLGTKVIIVFRELPDDPDHCLVVETKTLNEMYHDQLLRVVDSAEAQKEVDLYNVLGRRNFGDGQIMINALHNRGLLKKESVDQISVVPMPNRSAPLRDINEQIRADRKQPSGKTAQPTVVEDPVTKVPPPEVGSEEQKKSLAETKLLTARLMEEDAQKLREEAYTLDPSLKKGGRPSKVQQKKADTLAAE